MITQKNRFHGYNSLRFIFKKGQTLRSDHFTIRHMPSRNTNYRLAVVVSKKVDKKAVTRNRIRRRLYELFRQTFKDCSPAIDLVIIVHKPELATMPAGELQALFRPYILQLNTKYKL